MIQNAPTWFLFAALATPLACVAWTSRRVAREINTAADYEPKTVSESEIVHNDDGTSSQTITVSALQSVSGHITIPFGPISISANAREWAANATLLGLVLVCVGMIGLLHFPVHSVGNTRPGPMDYIGPQSIESGEQ